MTMRTTRIIAAAALILFAASQAAAQPSPRRQAQLALKHLRPDATRAYGEAVPEARASAKRALRGMRTEARSYYQGRNRGPEQSETFSGKYKVGRDGRVSISNVSGSITVTASSGDEVSIDAVKHGRRADVDRVQILVEEHPGRLDVRTDYPRFLGGGVDVDYTVVVPAAVALDVRSVSGRVSVDGVRGTTRLTSVSGDIRSSNTPGVEYARTVSGDIEIGAIAHDGTLSVSSVSGGIRLNGVKARAVDMNTVSGDLELRDAACERLNGKTLSGGFEYTGRLARNGRYDVNTHSGDVRFALAGDTGFQLSAGSFSGSIRSDFRMTIGGDGRDLRQRRGPGGAALQSTFGDGSALLNIRTFSGGITIAKQ